MAFHNDSGRSLWIALAQEPHRRMFVGPVHRKPSGMGKDLGEHVDNLAPAGDTVEERSARAAEPTTRASDIGKSLWIVSAQAGNADFLVTQPLTCVLPMWKGMWTDVKSRPPSRAGVVAAGISPPPPRPP